jgi:hypothetical protein
MRPSHKSEWIDAASRCEQVKNFGLEELRAALAVPGPTLQSILSELRAMRWRLDEMSGTILEHVNAGNRAQRLGQAHSILKIVAEELDVPLGAILRRGRTARVAWARQVAMYFVRDITGLEFQTIGKLFNRDHGTVMFGCQAVKNRAEVSHREASQLAELAARLGGVCQKNNEQALCQTQTIRR